MALPEVRLSGPSLSTLECCVHTIVIAARIAAAAAFKIQRQLKIAIVQVYGGRSHFQDNVMKKPIEIGALKIHIMLILEILRNIQFNFLVLLTIFRMGSVLFVANNNNLTMNS